LAGRAGETSDALDRRILIVEDDAIVALDIASLIMGANGKVVGPATTVTKALQLAANGNPSLAVLDFHLGRETARPVAWKLEAQGVPFLFHTATEIRKMSESWPKAVILAKPVPAQMLVKSLISLASRAPAVCLSHG